jgi:uroporphyrin-III C-methyltransferase
MRGHVTLVGAGPGDPELLTFKAARAIGRATVLLVDDLVSDGVLAFADATARVIHVGKRGGCASTPQAFIDKLMLAEALKGETVVRLKGGDPFMFGRGGEEGDRLRAHGIDVDVVGGITSGMAAASALGVPLTHRDHAHGVIFVTGHPRAEVPATRDPARADGAALDWRTLGAAAAQGLTLVIYMGVSAIDVLSHGLLQTLPGATPAAVVQHASLPQQRVLSCTLATLASSVQSGRIGSPAIVIVGNVLYGLQGLARPETRAA